MLCQKPSGHGDKLTTVLGPGKTSGNSAPISHDQTDARTKLDFKTSITHESFCATVRDKQWSISDREIFYSIRMVNFVVSKRHSKVAYCMNLTYVRCYCMFCLYRRNFHGRHDLVESLFIPLNMPISLLVYIYSRSNRPDWHTGG